MDKTIKAAMEGLLRVATGETPHIRRANCPENGSDDRQQDCPACQAIERAESCCTRNGVQTNRSCWKR
jgi:hypothetical protein